MELICDTDNTDKDIPNNINNKVFKFRSYIPIDIDLKTNNFSEELTDPDSIVSNVINEAIANISSINETIYNDNNNDLKLYISDKLELLYSKTSDCITELILQKQTII